MDSKIRMRFQCRVARVAGRVSVREVIATLERGVVLVERR